MKFSEGKSYITNKEWLLTLDDEVLAELILDGLRRYAFSNISPIRLLTEWLGEEHTKNP